MKENKKLVGKILKSVAKVSSEPASISSEIFLVHINFRWVHGIYIPCI